MKRTLIWLFFTPFFFSPLLISDNSDRLVIFPYTKKFPLPETYCDTSDSSGRSTCSYEITPDTTISFCYTLRKHPQTQKDPYTAVYITLDSMSENKTTSTIDISKYDSIRIYISSTNHLNDVQHPKSFKIQLKFEVTNFTIRERPETYPIEICEIIFKADEKCYTRSLKNDFHLAPCVYKLLKVNTLPHKLNHSNLFGIDIQTGSLACVGDSVSGSFRIEGIEFFKAPFLRNFFSTTSHKQIIVFICLLFSIIYILVILLYFLYKRSRKLEQATHLDINRIKEIIKSNSHIVSLNAQMIANKLEVSEKNLNSFVEGKNSTTIKDLIHKSRIDAEVEENLTKVVLPNYKPMHKYTTVNDEDTEYVLSLFRKSFTDKNFKTIISGKPEINEEKAVKLLQQFMGLTSSDYLKTIRVKVAEKMIEDDPSIKLGYVSDSVGFRDQPALTKAFESVEGMSPGSFSKHMQKKESSIPDLQ